MADRNESDFDKDLTIDRVLQVMDLVQVNKKKAEDLANSKTAFDSTLRAVQTIGDVVGSAASNVFPPSKICLNAFTFAIKAWLYYQDSFVALTGLFEKCTEFLERLLYYHKFSMDDRLINVASELLEVFVNICDHTQKLGSRRFRLGTMMKQTFLDDDEVKVFLDKMHDLTEKEHRLVSAQTWTLCRQTEANSRDTLNKVIEDRNQKQQDKDRNRWMVSISEALDYDLKWSESSHARLRDPDRSRHKVMIPQTGEWLIEDSRFKSWATGSGASPSILGLVGGSGTGKTLLASKVIKHLRKTKTLGDSDSRVVVAFKYVDDEPRSKCDENKAGMITSELLYQLAVADQPVMKSFAGICERSRGFNEPLDMWTQLLLENEDLVKINVTFFVVLDGLCDQVSILGRILQRIPGSRVRIFLTGQKNMFDALDGFGVEMEKIALGEVNNEDLQLYIRHGMDEIDHLRNGQGPLISGIRNKILLSLGSSAGGNYYTISRVLDEISRTGSAKRINHLLDQSGMARSVQIKQELEALNQALTETEIKEVNETILWVNHGVGRLTPSEMDAALTLGLGDATSLLPLESRIKSKYTILSIDSDGHGTVGYKASGTEEAIPVKESAVQDSERFIQPAEVNIVKHHLKANFTKELYDKFGFDDFFKTKMSQTVNRIYKDPENAHVRLLMSCMECLLDERSRAGPLYNYATSNLYTHLDAADLSVAGRSFKSQAGSMLVKLFTDQEALASFFGLYAMGEDGLESSFCANSMPKIWDDWVFHNKGVHVIAKWLNDSTVVGSVKENHLVNSFNRSEDSNRHLILFEVAAKSAARQVFRLDTSRSHTLRAFTFLSAILGKASKGIPYVFEYGTNRNIQQETKVQDETPSKTKTSDHGIQEERVLRPTLEQVERVEAWSQDALSMPERDAMWEAQASMLLSYFTDDNIPVAEERARRAMGMDTSIWVSSYALSKVIDSRDASIKLLQDLVERLINDTEWQREGSHKQDLATIILDLGNKHWEDDECQDEAAGVYSRVFELDWSASIIIPFSDILWKYWEAERWDDMIHFLKCILNPPDGSHSVAGKFMLHNLSQERSFQQLLFRLTEAKKDFGLLNELYERAIALEATTEPWKPYNARYCHGKTLFDIEGHEEEGVVIWEQNLKPINRTATYIVPAWMKLATSKATCDRAEEFFEKIEALYEEFEALKIRETPACATFAQYFRSRHDQTRAKQALKQCVVEALEMLSDDDTENDLFSFFELNYVFSAMRDIPNLMVAFEMMHQTKLALMKDYEQRQEKHAEAESKGEGSEPTMVEKQERPDMTLIWCDGCYDTFEVVSEVWTCLTDGGVTQLDEACYGKLKDGKLKLEDCHKDHEFHKVPKRDDEIMDAVPHGHVLVEGKIMTFEEWKGEIKAKYVNSE
ncbi:hypothetical protein CEP54_010251 [Fusarium duplospermum]|uniref:Uncharacterized protein n=1 Tax=Fusarium duplospermum TaxID=1325734 RepID=A0A428PL36_9HYPO|nr:hypothetical protein CEP54_010251 [Fusarium duplospermum]